MATKKKKGKGKKGKASKSTKERKPRVAERANEIRTLLLKHKGNVNAALEAYESSVGGPRKIKPRMYRLRKEMMESGELVLPKKKTKK